MRVISASQLKRTAPLHAPQTASWTRFTIAQICFELRCDDAGIVEAMRLKYADHHSAGEPQFVYTVWEDGNAYYFSCPHAGSWMWDEGPLPPSALAFLTDAALMSALVQFDPALRSMHAAAVSVHGRGAAIVGDSTAGKTTTLLACARAGMKVFSDERALMRADVLQPFLRECSVREGGRALLLADEAQDVLAHCLRSQSAFSLREAFGAAACAAPAQLCAVFILRRRSDTPRVVPVDAAQALPSISQWFDMRGDRLDRLACAIALLRKANCFELHLGTPAASAAAIRSALEALA